MVTQSGNHATKPLPYTPHANPYSPSPPPPIPLLPLPLLFAMLDDLLRIFHFLFGQMWRQGGIEWRQVGQEIHFLAGEPVDERAVRSAFAAAAIKEFVLL